MIVIVAVFRDDLANVYVLDHLELARRTIANDPNFEEVVELAEVSDLELAIKLILESLDGVHSLASNDNIINEDHDNQSIVRPSAQV